MLLASRTAVLRTATLVSLVVAGLLIGLAPDAPAVSSKDVRRQLLEATERLESARERDIVLVDDIRRLERRVAEDNKALGGITGRLAQRARLLYTSGVGDGIFEAMVTSPDPDETITRIAMLDAATRSDRALLLRSRAMRRRLEGTRQKLMAARRESAKLVAVGRLESARIARLFAQTTDAEQDAAAALRSMRSNQARASRERAPRNVKLSGRYACLVGPNNSYRNTWGAPRSGGRRHKGTDVFAPMNSGAYAVTDGTITRTSYSGNGGKQVYLRGRDGNEYFYAHMSSYVARAGQRVSAGDLIAYVGDTGNARGGSPHIHFEVHPGGGGPVNPYPYVRRFCA